MSACFGGIDAVKPLPEHEGIDAFFYTDAQGAASDDDGAARTWTRIIVPPYPREDLGPRLRGKYFKLQIPRIDEVREYRWLVWADGSVRFKDLGAFRDAAKTLARLPENRRALFIPHPERNTISEEFQFVRDRIAAGDPYLVVRYSAEKMPEQMEYFRSRGWDLNARLWCGTVWMIENNDRMRRAWDTWWHQNLRFRSGDQLSLPVVLAASGIEPQALDVHLWDNAYFTCMPHRREM